MRFARWPFAALRCHTLGQQRGNADVGCRLRAGVRHTDFIRRLATDLDHFVGILHRVDQLGRLLDSAPARAAIEACPAAPLVLILSGQLFESVVAGGMATMSPSFGASPFNSIE